MRYFLDITYKGTVYQGWQIQKNGITVQSELQRCIGTILRQDIDITGSGRTDAGVHAKQQIAHLDTDTVLTEREHMHRFNSFLPKDIAINSIRSVKDDAHARFDAFKRSYEYHLVQTKDPFNNNTAYHFTDKLDVNAMNEACKTLLGRQDFECFSKVHTEVNHFFCEITRAEWKPSNGKLVFHISADRFLRNMVRAIVGTLLDIGTGKKSKSDLEGIIESKDRCQAGRSVPAHGLYLCKVEYPSEVYI